MTRNIGMPILLGMNWIEIMADLRNAGLSQDRIAKEIGITQASVSDIATGKTKTPRWETGTALLALHKRVMRTRKAA